MLLAGNRGDPKRKITQNQTRAGRKNQNSRNSRNSRNSSRMLGIRRTFCPWQQPSPPSALTSPAPANSWPPALAAHPSRPGRRSVAPGVAWRSQRSQGPRKPSPQPTVTPPPSPPVRTTAPADRSHPEPESSAQADRAGEAPSLGVAWAPAQRSQGRAQAQPPANRNAPPCLFVQAPTPPTLGLCQTQNTGGRDPRRTLLVWIRYRLSGAVLRRVQKKGRARSQ